MRTGAVKRALISGLIGIFLTMGGVARGQTYYVQPGDSLYSIAARYGTSTAALQQVNGLATATVYPGQVLQISRPVGTYAGYTVRPGDSLIVIAERYQVPLSALKEANNLSVNYVRAGQHLTIPESYRLHRVETGESLFTVAQRYGVTVETIQKANGISGSSIGAGQTLKIPLAGGGTSQTGSKLYIVKNGEPLYLIAKRYGISLTALLSANRLSNASSILPGQRLIIPAPSTGGGSSGNGFNLSQSDLDLLARLVSAESAGEPFSGQVAVAATILNRLEDPRYPKTISGIIYQVDNGSYQYSPVLDGRINQPAGAGAYQAVEQALAGADPSNGANGFYNPEKTTNQWVRSQTVTATIGEHVFFRY